jgi:hypothetical protein
MAVEVTLFLSVYKKTTVEMVVMALMKKYRAISTLCQPSQK